MAEISLEILPYVPFWESENNAQFVTENNVKFIIENEDVNYPSRGRVGAYKLYDSRIIVDIADSAMVARYGLTEQQF